MSAAALTPNWVIVKISPAIVAVPVRAVMPLFAATEKLTVPLPMPELPESMVIQGALLTASQPHPASAFTLTDLLPAAALIVDISGTSVARQVCDDCTAIDNR